MILRHIGDSDHDPDQLAFRGGDHAQGLILVCGVCGAECLGVVVVIIDPSSEPRMRIQPETKPESLRAAGVDLI